MSRPIIGFATRPPGGSTLGSPDRDAAGLSRSRAHAALPMRSKPLRPSTRSVAGRWGIGRSIQNPRAFRDHPRAASSAGLAQRRGSPLSKRPPRWRSKVETLLKRSPHAQHSQRLPVSGLTRPPSRLLRVGGTRSRPLAHPRATHWRVQSALRERESALRLLDGRWLSGTSRCARGLRAIATGGMSRAWLAPVAPAQACAGFPKRRADGFSWT